MHTLTIKTDTAAFAATLLTNCTTLKDSLLLGGAVGAASGAVVGRQMGGDDKSTAIGAATGAAFGGIIGYAAHKDKIQKDKNAAARARYSPGKQKSPNLNNPEVESIWIPDRIEDDQFIEGHYIHVIRKGASWKQEE